MSADFGLTLCQFQGLLGDSWKLVCVDQHPSSACRLHVNLQAKH